MRPRAWMLIPLLLAAGCGSADVIDLDFGTLQVDTMTAGPNQDPNAYNLQVSGPSLSVNQTIGLNDRVVFTVTPGSYTARLTDVADGCQVDSNPVSLQAAAGITSRVTFMIACV